MCKTTADSAVYEGITFQNKAGTLVSSTEKLVFRREIDAVEFVRSWLWSSIKKTHVVGLATKPEKEDNDDAESPVMRILKICNHSNKAVSFLVPEDVVEKLREDIKARMAAARESKQKKSATSSSDAKEEEMQGLKKGKRSVHRSTSSDDSLNYAIQLSQVAKAAKNSGGKQTLTDSRAPGTPRATKADSVSVSSPTGSPANKELRLRPKHNKIKRTKSEAASVCSSSSSRSRKGGSLRSSCPEQRNTAPREQDSPSGRSVSGVRSSLPRTKRSLIQSTKIVAEDLFLKPSQQMVNDFVATGNNLIVKPTKRNIIAPANEKIVKPAQEKAQDKIIKPVRAKLIKPTKEKIVRPTQQAAGMLLLPPKVIAQDMGILTSRSMHSQRTSVSIEDVDDDDDASVATTGSPTKKKKAFLHFLKAPPKRKHSFDKEHLVVKDPAAMEADEPAAPKSSGSKVLSSVKGSMKASRVNSNLH